MSPYIFLSLLGSAVVIGTGFVIGGFQVLKHIARRRAQGIIDRTQITALNKTIEQIAIRQKAIFVMGVIVLGVLLFARAFSH